MMETLRTPVQVSAGYGRSKTPIDEHGDDEVYRNTLNDYDPFTTV